MAAANPGLAVIGNGDVLTHWEVAARLGGGSPVAGLMVGRGALEKPWLWKEVADGATWLPSAEERVAVLRAFMGRMQACRDGHQRNEILIRSRLEAIRNTLRILQNSSETDGALQLYDRLGRVSEGYARKRYTDA